MNDARAEREDLMQNPLPPVVILEPLTRVWELDAEIAKLQKRVGELLEQRTSALNYALDNAIEEDAACKLVAEKHVSTPNQIINTEKIKTELPKVYFRIWDLKRSEVKAELDKFGAKVEENKVVLKFSQKVAETALKAEGHKLEEVLIPGGLPMVSYTYEVVRR